TRPGLPASFILHCAAAVLKSRFLHATRKLGKAPGPAGPIAQAILSKPNWASAGQVSKFWNHCWRFKKLSFCVSLLNIKESIASSPSSNWVIGSHALYPLVARLALFLIVCHSAAIWSAVAGD